MSSNHLVGDLPLVRVPSGFLNVKILTGSFSELLKIWPSPRNERLALFVVADKACPIQTGSPTILFPALDHR
ncbi:hypothetical protein TNCV_2987301 [Trichonephila clavipes]|nr:hypothetical protein TNCV_2987301 [Trichonephila clavipes]